MVTGIQTAGLSSLGLGGTNGTTPQLQGLRAQVSAKTDSPFADLIMETVKDASALEDRARLAVDGLMTGNGIDVHQAMIASEKASMAFEMALAFRNKAVQSYQSVMNMQF